MKVALFLTGHIRTFEKTKQSLLNLFKEQELDIYCCTWDNNGHYSISNKFELEIKKELILSEKQFNLQKKTFKFEDRNHDIFKTCKRAAEHGEYWINRLMAQWYCVQKSFDLLENYEEYDLIFRSRYDILFSEKIIFKKNNFLNVPINKHHVYNDHFAYGSPVIMKKYSNLYDAYLEMYRKSNVDISYAEKMLKFYIEDYCKIKTSFFNYNYRILK